MKKVKRFVKQNGVGIDSNNRRTTELRLKSGAGDEARTRDPLLGKQMLYH